MCFHGLRQPADSVPKFFPGHLSDGFRRVPSLSHLGASDLIVFLSRAGCRQTMFVSEEEDVFSEVELETLKPFWHRVDPRCLVDDRVWHLARVHDGEVVEREPPEFGTVLDRPLIKCAVILPCCQSGRMPRT
jgi:hypothetical protein